MVSQDQARPGRARDFSRESIAGWPDRCRSIVVPGLRRPFLVQQRGEQFLGAPFPMMSGASRVLVRSASSCALRRRSFSNSTCSAVFLGRFDGAAGSAGSVVRVPTSRARVHSMTCEEQRPSRRRITPFSPWGCVLVLGDDGELVLGAEHSTGSAAGELGWSSDGVDTYTRISDPALGLVPRYSDKEGRAAALVTPYPGERTWVSQELANDNLGPTAYVATHPTPAGCGGRRSARWSRRQREPDRGVQASAGRRWGCRARR